LNFFYLAAPTIVRLTDVATAAVIAGLTRNDRAILPVVFAFPWGMPPLGGDRHCEERSNPRFALWIASFLAMTGLGQ